MPSDTVSPWLVGRWTRTAPAGAPPVVRNVFFHEVYAAWAAPDAAPTVVSVQVPEVLFCGNVNGPPLPSLSPRVWPPEPEPPMPGVSPPAPVAPPAPDWGAGFGEHAANRAPATASATAPVHRTPGLHIATGGSRTDC